MLAQTTTFLGIPAPALYALAVILAALIGFMGQSIHRWLNTRTQRQKLRQGLNSEIESMEWIQETDLAQLKESLKDGDLPTHTFVPTDFYDSNTTEIGLLSDDEINAVLRYYQTAHVAQEQLNTMMDPLKDNQDTRKTFADRTLNKLKDTQETAAEATSK